MQRIFISEEKNKLVKRLDEIKIIIAFYEKERDDPYNDSRHIEQQTIDEYQQELIEVNKQFDALTKKK